ncbi:hypothetical protein J5N97_023811 [Dioscorea zingiberensis]|uniref:Peptidase M14 domain-containing protein n=1 Tax=Dioscorea zingiberensis TaxID=325984 RepID=A0A9D5C5Y0_9LILI|nr:hypothetical protein J5N97_023811 [Dioscorea zingiberensis]
MGSIPLLPILYLLAFLRLLCFVNGANSSDPSLTPIPRHLYHSCDSLLKEVKALVHRHPEKLTAETLREDDKGYAAEIVVVTYNSAKIPKNGNLKFRVLLSFGQHGRELITSEVSLRLLSILTGERTMPGVGLNLLNSFLDNLVIKMVPMENWNGRKLVEAGEFCERRNGRGVDLNRNWSVDWGKKEKDYDPYEENPGTGPFSEPETQIMRKLSQSFEPHVWVNVHSGMEALFMPYDHKNVTPDGLISHLMRSLLEDLNHHHCQDKCLVGSGGGSVGYLAHGTSTDYMHDIVKVPMAFTFEIYGDSAASSKDCVKMFNPVDEASFNKVIGNWCAAFLMLFQTGPGWLDIARQANFTDLGKWVSIDASVVDGRGGSGRGGKLEGLDLGMQELRTYFRLFMLSSVLIMFMFCSRISKSKCRPSMSSIPL